MGPEPTAVRSSDVQTSGVKKFLDVILATGDAVGRAEGYRLFRGRESNVDALLKTADFR